MQAEGEADRVATRAGAPVLGDERGQVRKGRWARSDSAATPLAAMRPSRTTSPVGLGAGPGVGEQQPGPQQQRVARRSTTCLAGATAAR